MNVRSPLRPTRTAAGAVDLVEDERQRLRASGRAAIGVTGEEDIDNLRDALRASGVGAYPLVALGLLFVVDQFQGSAFGTLAPDISRSLGLSQTTIAALINLRTLALSAAALPIAALVQRLPR